MTLPESFAQLGAGPIFVLGHQRSGTTWVYDILTAHPEVCGIYESWLFTSYAGLGALFAWQQWEDRPPEERFGLRQMLAREVMVAEVRSLAAGWMSRVLTGDQRFLVEKSPAHLAVADLIAEIFPEARFVSVVRDGRDVAVSVRAASKTWARHWQRGVGRFMWGAAREWRHAMRTSADLRVRLGPERFLEIKYEDIRADPFAAYRTLFSFAGIPWDDELLTRVHEATDFERHFSGGEGEFRRGGRVGDWKSRFSTLDAFAFARGAGDALIESGYETGRWWWLRPRFAR